MISCYSLIRNPQGKIIIVSQSPAKNDGSMDGRFVLRKTGNDNFVHNKAVPSYQIIPDQLKNTVVMAGQGISSEEGVPFGHLITVTYSANS